MVSAVQLNSIGNVRSVTAFSSQDAPCIKSASMGSRVWSWFKNHPLVLWDKKHMASTLVNKVWKVASAVSYSAREIWGLIAKSHLPNVSGSHVFKKAIDWFTGSTIFKFLRLATICSAAYSALAFLYRGYEFALGTVDEKIDAALKMMTCLSDMGQSLSAFMTALVLGGMASGKVLAWVPGINIASAAFALGTVGLNIKNAVQHNQVLNKFKGLQNEEGKNSLLNHFAKMDVKQLEKDFEIDGTCLKKRLLKIQERKNPEERDAILNNLKKRVSDQIFSEKLSIVSSTVGVLGLGVLIFSPFVPVAMVGFGLLAISSIIGVGALIYNLVSKHRFEKASLIE